MPEWWGMWLVELHGRPIGEWLESYDPEAFGGRGDVTATREVTKAKRFRGIEDVMREWKRISERKPWRDDGRPNRPLSAFTIEPRRLP